MNYASLWRRIWGGIIDIIFIIIFSAIYIHSLGTPTGDGTYHTGSLATLILLVIIFLYYVILEAIYGRTIGKYIAGTKVVSLTNTKITWGQSIARNILRVIDGLFAYLVAVITIASTRHNQRIGDLAAKTVVISRS